MTNFFTQIFLNLFFLFLLCGSFFAQAGNEIAGDDKTSPKVVSETKVDGIIRDSEWSNAKVFKDFNMMIPKSENKDYDSTIAYIKQDKEAIYIAIKYWPKGKLIRQSLTRDRSTEEENEFFILLDLENKRQNGYIFVVSFLDNQRDALVYNQRNQSYEWDWQWENKSKIIKEPKDGQPGYVELEIKIPVDRIQNKNKKQFGIDLQLFSYKPDGNYYYYSIAKDAELLNLKNLYQFDITTPFDEKLNLRFNLTPFVMANKFNNLNGAFRFGGEFAVSLDKHKLKSTFHTDESTLEADPFRFSFYGRPIFLQEKRPFFSKDLDLFNTPINLFYTRAISNINYGFNYTYRSDKFKLGAVYVQEDTLQFAPGSKRTFIAARPKFNFQDFNIGGLVVHTRDTLNNFKETVVDVDAKIKLPSRFWFIPQFARSFNNDGTGGNLYNAYLFYESNSNGGPFMDAYYARYDSNFNASTLFNNYGNDYDEISFSGGYQFVRNSKTFSNISVNAGYYRARRMSDGFNYQNGFNLNAFYKVNGWLSVSHYLSYDRPNDFDANDARITYDNVLGETFAKVLFGSNSISAGFYGGKYFGSTLYNPYANIDLSFFGRLRLLGSYNYREFSDVKQSIYSVKLDLKVFDKLYLRSYFQKDTYGKRALWNTMVQYEFFGGSNVYLVLNLEGDRLQYTRRYFKVSYEFNF
ncbi:MAG TPA: hypothetical protein VG961_12660 [Ignavibacteria bacterium]|nr:hypothetical protein [Ignavibacteria bacterium]